MTFTKLLVPFIFSVALCPAFPLTVTAETDVSGYQLHALCMVAHDMEKHHRDIINYSYILEEKADSLIVAVRLFNESKHLNGKGGIIYELSKNGNRIKHTRYEK